MIPVARGKKRGRNLDCSSCVSNGPSHAQTIFRNTKMGTMELNR